MKWERLVVLVVDWCAVHFFQDACIPEGETRVGESVVFAWALGAAKARAIAPRAAHRDSS